MTVSDYPDGFRIRLGSEVFDLYVYEGEASLQIGATAIWKGAGEQWHPNLTQQYLDVILPIALAQCL